MHQIIKRIEEMEQIFDALLAAGPKGVLADERLLKQLDRLTAYYESHLWRADYEADERGELPQGLKRGVLSQDGIYDFLHELEQTRKEKGENKDVSIDSDYKVEMAVVATKK